jgi:hypothetical protein
MDIAITTTAATDEEAFALLTELGMPFQRAERGTEGPTAAEVRQAEERRAKAEAEEAALEQLKEENPDAYAKPAEAPEAEGDEAAETPAEPAENQET